MIQNTIGVGIKIVPKGDPREVDQTIHDAIAKKAFQIFESHGGTRGGEQQDWILAESKVVRPLWSGVLETEDAVEVSACLSGFEIRSGIEIASEPGRLIISGVERVESERDNREPTKCLPSRIFGIVNLPTAVDWTGIESHLTGHVLQIRVPKAIQQSPTMRLRVHEADAIRPVEKERR
jgi:HSP20 family molecular chaperone IbpA